jgi:hypothetical protein
MLLLVLVLLLVLLLRERERARAEEEEEEEGEGGGRGPRGETEGEEVDADLGGRKKMVGCEEWQCKFSNVFVFVHIINLTFFPSASPLPSRTSSAPPIVPGEWSCSRAGRRPTWRAEIPLARGAVVGECSWCALCVGAGGRGREGNRVFFGYNM